MLTLGSQSQAWIIVQGANINGCLGNQNFMLATEIGLLVLQATSSFKEMSDNCREQDNRSVASTMSM